MAATGKTPILLYGSTTPTNAPVAGNLTNSSDGCEIAINVADKNLFFKDSTNAVNTVPIRQSSASSNGWLSSTDWNTFNSKSPAAGSSSITTVGTITSGTWNGSTIDVAHGGTGLTSLTAGYIPYGNGTGAFSSSGNFYYSGTDLFVLNGGAKIGGVIWTGGGAGFSNNGVGMWFDTGSNTGYLRSYHGGVDWRAMVYNAKSHQFQTNDNNVVKIHNSGGVSIGNFTDPGATNLSVSGNVVIGTSGKGIDFSATPGTGTSELLADYEEGTWTPNQGSGLIVVGAFSSSGTYTKIGNIVTAVLYLRGATSIAVSAGGVILTNLPFNRSSASDNTSAGTAQISETISSVKCYSNTIYATSALSGATELTATITYPA